MKTYLKNAFTKAVAGATNISVEDFQGEAAGAVADGQTYLDSFTGYTLKGARSAVAIAVFSPGDGPPPSQACGEGSCSVQHLPAGDSLMITKFKAGDQLEIVTVTHYRTDGVVVAASGYNYDPTAQAASHLAAMPVTVEQLTKLATDPALGI
jgi:hypothetical protein